MKFAQYWEKIEVPIESTRFTPGVTHATVWGASNESQADARHNAEKRVEQFKILHDSDFDDVKSYSYTNGYIKEEVIEEFKSADDELLGVLTRNHYGALVLNTTQVFIADVDVPSARTGLFVKLMSLFGRTQPTADTLLQKIESVQQQNPNYTFQVFKTFAGYRVFIVNEAIDPHSDVAKKLFKTLSADRLYVRLCKAQSCYRARLTPKPWRIGLTYPDPATRFPRKDQYEITYQHW